MHGNKECYANINLSWTNLKKKTASFSETLLHMYKYTYHKSQKTTNTTL